MEVDIFLQVTLDVDQTLSTHATAVHWLFSTVSCSSYQFLTLRFAWEAACAGCEVGTACVLSQAPSGTAVSKAVLASTRLSSQQQGGGRGGQPVPSPRAGISLAPTQLAASSPGDPVSPVRL